MSITKRIPQVILSITFIILIVLIVIALTWVNYQFSEENPGGNDFLVHWVGARALIFEEISPYSDIVAERIQTIAYGRPAKQGEHELRVAYQLYSIMLFGPFALIEDYNLARSVWMTTLEVALFLMLVISLRLTKWEPKIWLYVILGIFIISWYHGVRAIINGNAVILVAFLLYASLDLIQSGKDELAGVVLAFTSIKPQLVILTIPLILLWAFSHRRMKLIAWTSGGLIGYIIMGILVIPDWILQNIREILRYPDYNPAGTVTAVIREWFPGIGIQIGWVIWITLLLILVFETVGAWRKEYPRFVWYISLVLLISQWIGIQTDPGNFIILLLPLIVVFANFEKRWGTKGSLLTTLWIGILFTGLWWLFLTTIETGQNNQQVQNPIMFFPLPGFLLLGLYWVRWWALRSRKSFL